MMAEGAKQPQPSELQPVVSEVNCGAAGKHGWDYQVNVTLLCYHRGYHRGYTYELSIEKDGNGKFDDLDFKFQKNAKSGRILFQIKFKEKDTAVITYSNLICKKRKAKKDKSKRDRRFDLKTYFESYKNMKDLSAEDILCIYTNIGIESNSLSCFEEIPTHEKAIFQDLLASDAFGDGKCPKFYKLKYSEKIHKDLNLTDNDMVTFLEFLGKLVFAVNQPNNEQLIHLVEKELIEKYNLVSSGDIFKRSSAEISSYISNPTSKCLSDKEAKQNFDLTQSQLNPLNLLGVYVNGECLSKQPNFNFFSNVSTLKNISDTKETLIHVSSKSTALSFIKVVQYFKSKMNDSDFNLGFAAMDLKTLLKNEAKSKESLKNFVSYCLVVEIMPLEERKQEAAISLLKFLIDGVYRSGLQRKLVFISAEDDKLCWSVLRGKSYEYLDDQCQFKDFSTQVKGKIVDQLTALKGEELLLNIAESLLNTWQFPKK